MQSTFCFIFSVFLFCSHPAFGQQKSFLVCGDSKVLLVDYLASKDSLPKIIWEWNAATLPEIPVGFDAQKFKTMDDCKPLPNGRFLVSASSGGIALINNIRKIEFFADVPNAHSIEMLPGGLIAAAASTAKNGNAILLFDPEKGNKPLFRDSLYSAHGLVWIKEKRLLYALGYHVLRAYEIKMGPQPQLVKKHEWKIPGKGGHDLQLAPDKNLFVTAETGVWKFDVNKGLFSPIPGILNGVENIKSLGRDSSGQYIYTLPEESWWTFHVKFLKPERSFLFPAMHVYKARWFN